MAIHLNSQNSHVSVVLDVLMTTGSNPGRWEIYGKHGLCTVRGVLVTRGNKLAGVALISYPFLSLMATPQEYKTPTKARELHLVIWPLTRVLCKKVTIALCVTTAIYYFGRNSNGKPRATAVTVGGQPGFCWTKIWTAGPLSYPHDTFVAM